MKKILLMVSLAVLTTNGCNPNTISEVYVEPYQTQLPTPETIAKAILFIRSDNSEEQILGMWSILSYPNKDEALEYIVDNLHDDDYDVRLNAIIVLGKLGPSSNLAVPDLLSSLASESSPEIMIEITIALGSIGNIIAVPSLAENLSHPNQELAVYSAKSISNLTGVFFPDAQSSGYHVDGNGNPYILLAAKEWWKTEGQYQDWSEP